MRNRAGTTAGLLVVVTLLPAALAFQDTVTQPATRAAPTSQERLTELLRLIEGNTPPDARRTIIRELLFQQWPETPARLATLLAGPNTQAKVALAASLAELPQFLEPAYVDPLMAMLTDPETEARTAAARALAAYRDGGVTPRLRTQALAADQPRRARLGAIAALGYMTSREAIDGLAEVLTDPDEQIVAAGLAALQQASAMDFAEDAAAARSWWEACRTLPLAEWQRQQIDRLVNKDREQRTRLETLESRLAKALEASFQKATEPERVAMLTSYLGESSPALRQLGLRLVRLYLEGGKTPESLPAEVAARIRELMASSDARERAAAVQAVASFRRPQDAEQFIARLDAERSRAVRLALVNGLGYVGEGAAAEKLLEILSGADEEFATQAVAALGRLAERGALDETYRGRAVTALLGIFRGSRPAQVALRERVLWAMTQLADPRFGPAFAAGLDPSEAVAVRQAAVRGIALLNDARLADSLAAALADSDAGVRKAATEALANLATADSHLQALWARLSSPPETDDAVRQAAWRAVLKLLEKRPPEQIENWIAQLPGDGRPRAQRTLDLLQRIARVLQDAEPVDRARLGLVHARMASQHATLDQPAEALAEYERALADLDQAANGRDPGNDQSRNQDGDGPGATASQPTPEDLGGDHQGAATSEPVLAARSRVALELLRYALACGRYDQAVARLLTVASRGPDRESVWEAVRTQVEALLTAETADRALAALDAVEADPPIEWSAEMRSDLARLRERAVQLKSTASEGAVSRPAGA